MIIENLIQLMIVFLDRVDGEVPTYTILTLTRFQIQAYIQVSMIIIQQING